MKQMKTLTIGPNTYEVVDETARGRTYADVGAAPAGYGLGTNTAELPNISTLSEADALLVNCTRRLYLESGNIEGSTIGTLVVDAGERYVKQTFFSEYSLWGGFYELVRVWTYGNDWQPWEWVNPPMIPNVEYRTTERWNGKPVYAKAVDMGTMPNASIREVEHGIEDIQYVIDLKVFARDAANNILYAPSTAGADTTLTAAAGVGINTVWVNTVSNRSAMSGYAYLKYTKTAD